MDALNQGLCFPSLKNPEIKLEILVTQNVNCCFLMQGARDVEPQILRHLVHIGC